MNKKIKIIFFDLGDTLVDMSISRRAFDYGIKEVLPDEVNTAALVSKLEREIHINFVHYYKKSEFYTVKRLQEISLKKVLLGEGVDLEDHKLNSVFNKFWQYVIKNCRLYDDVMPTLSQLIKDGYELGLITNADEQEVNSILKQHNLDGIFKIKVISSVLEIYKPSIMIFERALELVKCLPNEAIYVGDSISDTYGAKQLGVNTVIVCRTKTQDPIIKTGKDFRINDLQQLSVIIDKFET